MNRKSNFANVVLSALIGLTLILSAAQPVMAVGAMSTPTNIFSMPSGSPNPADIDRFVASTGVDSGDCTNSTLPCQSLTYAYNQVQADGEIIAVAEGVYVNNDPSNPFVAQIRVVSPTHPYGANIYGGWNSDYSTQSGFSIIDGEKKYRGVSVWGYPHFKNIFFDHFIIMNGSDGGISNSFMNLFISNSAIFNNVISGVYADGGGIENYYGNITLNNVTISHNTTFAEIGGSGGGIYSYGGSATLNNVTITNNSSYDGGGIYLGTAGTSGASISVMNSILYNNHASHIGPDCYYGPSTGNTNNIIGDTTGCTMFSAGDGNQLNINPQLGTFVEGVGYQPLLAGSPAINAGANCYGTTDQRGYVRIDVCDIGAYEYPSSVGNATRLVLAGGSNQTAAPLTPFTNPLSVAALDASGSPVSGQSVGFSAPGSGPSATFPGGGITVNETTGPDGVVSVVATANNESGMYAVTADSSGLSGVSFNLRNLAWFVRPDGDDLNDCSTPSTPCATINAAINKLSEDETIFVAAGIYLGTGASVVEINKKAIIKGGWDPAFSVQEGYSTIDGEHARMGVNHYASGTRLDHFIIQNGKAVAFGGGINTGGNLTLTHCIIRNNTGSYGGGIFNNGVLSLDQVLIYDNKGEVGGGIYTTGTSLTVNNSAVFNNSGYDGGGIAGNAIITINNSTIRGNRAKNGGGIESGGVVSTNNVTISNNYADAEGGGVYNTNNAPNSFVIKNSILGNNTAVTGGPDCRGQTITSAGYNIVSATDGCAYTSATGDLLNTDPKLGIFLPSRGYQSLLPDSPAIDAGLGCYGTTDQRGVTRVGQCDIGAYEYDPVGSPVSIEIVGGDNQRTAPLFPFPNPFSVAILDDNGSPVSGESITFSAPASGPSGTFANLTNEEPDVLTDSGGIATSSIFTANDQSGSYTVLAASSVGSVSFNVANQALYVELGGSDSNDCQSPATACASIEGAIGKAFDGDIILVSAETYTGSGAQIINLTKDLTLIGGWNSAFTAQSGYSTLDGGGVRSGVIVPTGVTAHMEMFIVTNSWNNSLQRGGISNDGTLTLSHCEISHNSPSYRGGGINNSGILTLSDCTVKMNSTSMSGGGIYNTGQLTIQDSIVEDNTSGTSSGGGIYNEGTATISNSLIIGNDGFLGAGIFNIGVLSLTQSSVSQNTSANGGGLWLDNTSTVVNSTIYGNTASGPGGGIYASAGTSLLNNVTVSGNQASSGGGIYKSSGGGRITIRNTILGNNQKTIGTGPDCNGAVVSDGYNIVSVKTGCTINTASGDQFNVDPKLATYQPEGYLLLEPGSPAIEGGNPAVPGSGGSACLASDQRGVARPEGLFCDIGAVEIELYDAPLFSIRSTGVRDGWVLESMESSNKGGTKNSTGTLQVGDDGFNKQYRSLLYFNTAALPYDAVIIKVTLKIKKQGMMGTNPFNTHGNLFADIREGFFGAAALEVGDFQATATKNSVGKFNVIAGAPGWYRLIMGVVNNKYINLNGVTQFRLRFAKDDNNDRGADYVKFFAGDTSVPAANRPILIIEYMLP